MMLLDRIQNLLSAPGQDGIIASQIAEEFGWQSSQIRRRTVGQNGGSAFTARALIGRQPTTLFVYSNKPESREAIRTASAYAYHQTIRWGLFCDSEGVSVFNSHWLSGGDIFVLPKMVWGRGEPAELLLRNFTPSAVLDRTIDRDVGRFVTPDVELRGVDDELVFRLDKWRDEALKYSREIENIDDDLQIAYAQFFVLRTIEDRSLNPALPPLMQALEAGFHLRKNALVKILAQARAEVCGDLFSRQVITRLPDEIIAGVIRDLYSPTGTMFPYRYNFDWLTSDVLGSAYEKYLSSVLAPAPPPNQLSLFEQPRRDVQRFSVRRAGGIYYTPQFITRYLTAAGFGEVGTPPFLAKTVVKCGGKVGDVAIPRVVDFACGSGSFLVAAIDELLITLKAKDKNIDWVKVIVDNQLLVGIDIDDKAVTIARLNIWQRLTEEPNPLPLPSLSQLIFQGDSLREDTWERAPGKFDLVLGNPPFIATRFIPDREYLEAHFDTAKGRYDFSYLFVEQALRKINSGGRIGLVIPNRLFGNMDAGSIRSLLTEKTDLNLVVDFGSERPFPEASAYVGCIVATSRGSNNAAEYLRFIRVLKVDPERLPAEITSAAQFGSEYHSELIDAYDAVHPRGSGAWTLTSQSEQVKRLLIAEESFRLGEIATIRQGIRTGANEIFIFQVDRAEGQRLLQGVNGLGEPVLVERSIAKPIVIGPEIERYVVAAPQSFLIYPYKSGIPLSEAELEREAPQAYKYLLRYRTVLSARRSIQGSKKGWYELVRQRNETWLASPKLLTRDLVPRPEFGIDLSGQSLLVGGTAIIPSDSELLFSLCAYLNSSFIDTLLRDTAPSFRGGFLKLEPQHLENLPIPKVFVGDSPFRDDIEGLARALIMAHQNSDDATVAKLTGELDEFISAWTSTVG